MAGLQDLHLLKNLHLMMMSEMRLNKRKTAIMMMDDMKCQFDIDLK